MAKVGQLRLAKVGQIFLAKVGLAKVGLAKVGLSRVNASLSRDDRDAFDRAKQKEWTSWLDKEAVELGKDRSKVPRIHFLRARWVLTWKNVGTEKVPKARLCALGFHHPRLTTLPTSVDCQ